MNRPLRAARALPIALCLTPLVTLGAGCAQSLGNPYDAAAVPTLTRGTSTPGDARRMLGEPLEAWPVRFTPAEAKEGKLACPNVAERWVYRYQDNDSYQGATSSCETTLEFDDAGRLCSVAHGSSFGANLAAKGPRCARVR